MKSNLQLSLLALISSLSLFACAGPNGKAFIQVAVAGIPSDEAEGWIASIEGFPSSLQGGTEYEIQPGTYDGTYVLWHAAAGHLSYNDANQSQQWEWSNYELAEEAYIYSGWYEAYANPFSYTIAATEEGGPLLTPGADTHYTLTLTWDPTDIDLSSSRLSPPSAIGWNSGSRFRHADP